MHDIYLESYSNASFTDDIVGSLVKKIVLVSRSDIFRFVYIQSGETLKKPVFFKEKILPHRPSTHTWGQSPHL